MEYYNNILCFEAGWLVDNQITTRTNYDNLAKRKQIQVVRRASRNTPALVAYDSMPDRFKEAIIEKMGGDPYKLAKLNALEDLIEHNTEASKFFNEDFKLSDGRWLPKQTRNEYYRNAIILDAITKLIEKVAVKKAKGHKTGGQWNYFSELVQGLDRTKHPHTLPDYFSSLREKYNKYIAEGYISLIHANFLKGIRNAAKIDDEVKLNFIITFLKDPRNLDNEQVARVYNEIAGRMNWRKITGHTVAKYRDEYDLEIYAGRRGSVSLYNNKAMQVKREAPKKPLYYWTMDGWDVELLYQKHNGKTITYHNRPTVVVVLDPCCKYPIGYAVGTHETPELIKEALRNAALHSAELFGSMYRTHQIQSDRYAYKTLEPIYAAMGKAVTPARAKNAKAKVIEPYFGYLNKNYCQFLPNWSGFGITSDKSKQPNVEFLNHYKKNFPDYEAICALVGLIIEKERQTKRDEYLQAWATLSEADKLELTHDSYLYLFGEKTGRKNLMQGDGLNVTIKGIKRAYDCFDLNFRRYASTQWNIVYDPDNTSKILAMNDDETLRFVLEEKYIQPMALKERKEGDAEQLQRVNQFNEQMTEHIIDTVAIAEGSTYNFIEEYGKQLDGTLGKLMITDSKGQHKDIRNIDKGRKKKTERIEVSPAEIVSKGKEKEKVQDIYDLM
jgi:hypothetical protein